MAKDKASTRKPRRRNARARDDGGTRRATEATPPVRASKRLSVQVSAAASAFLVNFRLRLDAIASIFVNYHEERQEFVAKTEAADLIEQNVAEMMGVVYRGASAGEFEIRTTSQIADEAAPRRTSSSRRRSSDRSAARAARAIARGTVAPAAASPAQLLIQFVVLPRKMGTGRDSLEAPVRLRPHALPPARREGRLPLRDGGRRPAWLTLGFEHVGSSASLIHLRFDLLFKRDRGVLAPPAVEASRLAAARWTALKIFSDSAGLYPMEQERNAFLERIQAEEVRREQARIAAARPVPPPPNRATGADDDSDGGFEESDNDDPVEDLIHRERIRERDLLRTPGCLALGRKAFRLEDMPPHASRRRRK
ncbi:hypothetical protein JL722_14075 [Aureococcus anophagefferens]|nr:hypothetical protein JL722_14075 [Aureococcus anophagefferens]